ncbi:MAG: pilus assembly protein PilP [Rhodobacteraceae bacterium]|nr:pilus assembly protein PilP [Paracoccaceae bacterium]
MVWRSAPRPGRPRARRPCARSRPPAPENPGALALAPRPPDRPDALARQIERRRAAAAEMRPETPPAAQPAAEPAAPAPAAAAPAVAAPQVPQTASVAAAATETNELSMRRLTLIGVLGTPSNRTALIRSPNGRITRVSVNDQIGRGRIVAIGPDSLSYVENGRTRTLEMP